MAARSKRVRTWAEDPSRICDLIYKLHRSSSDPAAWPEALEDLSAAVRMHSVSLEWCRIEGGRLHPFRSVVNLGGLECHQRYVSEITDSLNPRYGAEHLSNLGRVVQDKDLMVDGGELQRFRRALSGLGLGFFVGALWQIATGEFLALAMHRKLELGEQWGEAEQGVLGEVLRHLQQATSIAHSLQLANEPRFDAALMDLIPQGICLCGASGEVCLSNRAARELLASGRPLRIVDGCLRVPPRVDGGKLSAALARRSPSYFSLGDEFGEGSLQVSVHPFEGETLRYLLLMTRAGQVPTLPVHAFTDLFHLTPAESRLVAALCQGHSLSDYADMRGLSIDTVRSQVKEVFGKTQTSRQAELVSLILGSVISHNWGLAR